MFFTRKLCAVLAFTIGFAATSFSADTLVVSIIGYVNGWDGQPIAGATCHLKNLNLTTTSSALSGDPGLGYFKFDAIFLSAVRMPPLKSAFSSRPALTSDGLYFSVRQKMQQVKIDLFTLSGRKAVELVNSSMKPGNYKVNPYSGVKTSQAYIVRARIGDQTSYFKMPLFGNRIASSTLVQTLSSSAPANPLAKKAAVIDSLIVSAPNYVTNSWPIESDSGSYYVILRTAAQMQNKVLSFTCSINQGPTDNDPTVTKCTAIFIKDMSGNLNYRNTMFVNWWLSHEGYAYPNSIVNPDWRGPDTTAWSNFRTNDSVFVDAITKATPVVGRNLFEFNPGNFVLTAGTPYRFCFEMNVADQYHILYADTITLGIQSLVRTPAISYVPSADPAATVVGLTDMVISYK